MTAEFNPYNELGRVCAIVAHLLSNPEDAQYIKNKIKEDPSISDVVKNLIMNNITEPKKNKNSSGMEYDFSLNESIKREFDRFIK